MLSALSGVFIRSINAKDKTKRRFYSALGNAAQAQIGKIEILIGAVGTGHSLMGTADGITPTPYIVSAEPRDGNVSGNSQY